MQHEEFDAGEVHAEQEPDRGERREQKGEPPIRGPQGIKPGEPDREQRTIARHAVERDGNAEQRRVPAGLHGLAAPGAALELADHTDLVQPEVGRDEQPHEREEHKCLAPQDHLCSFVLRLSASALMSSEVARPSNGRPFTKKLGVPFTPSAAPSAALAWMRPAERWLSTQASYVARSSPMALAKSRNNPLGFLPVCAH